MKTVNAPSVNRLNQYNNLDIEVLTIIETTVRKFNSFTKSYEIMTNIAKIEELT